MSVTQRLLDDITQAVLRRVRGEVIARGIPFTDQDWNDMANWISDRFRARAKGLVDETWETTALAILWTVRPGGLPGVRASELRDLILEAEKREVRDRFIGWLFQNRPDLRNALWDTCDELRAEALI